MRVDGPANATCPRFSLIVATVGRKAEVQRLLASLVAQTYSSFEVILVDQNPSGYLDAILSTFQGRLDLLRIHTGAGVSSARNLGLQKARGSLIAFPDDDCWYLPHTLTRVHELFADNPRLAGLIASWAEKPIQKEAPCFLKRMTIFNAFRRAGTLVQFYNREFIQGIQFDPLLGPGAASPYGCGEDTDFLLQVLAKGGRVYSVQEVLLCHPEPDMQSGKLMPKVAAYAKGRMFLLEKHNYPLWFKIFNVCYPLFCLVIEGPKRRKYRMTMFLERLKAFCTLNS